MEEIQVEQPQRGGALIMALFLVIFVVGIVVSGASILKSNRTRTETAFLLTGQASQFARSGITDAINWFRRQPQQPVLQFTPQLDTVADPKILDTEDPDIGLVREFRIAGTIWGRYEVWKQWDADPDAGRLIWRQKMQAEDVSLHRGWSTAGSIWRIRCVGYVYDRRDDNITFREHPNRIVATEVLEAEISRLSLALPGQSAICCRVGSGVQILSNGRVNGGSLASGLFYPSGTGSPTISGGDVDGVPPMASSSVYDDSIGYVFGVTDEGLRSMADSHLTSASDFPAKIPFGSIIILEDTSLMLNLDKARPLSGSGIVVVRGNVVIQAGSSSVFSGLLYVEGDLSIHAPARIRGAVVVTGSISVQGIGDFAEVIYDDNTLTALQNTLANYRMSRPARRRVLGD